MNASMLLDDLRRRGVELWAEGDRLRYRAPAGTLTDDLRVSLAAHKAEIMALLDWPAELVRFADYDWTGQREIDQCENCGGPLEPHRLVRCDRCILTVAVERYTDDEIRERFGGDA